MRVGIPILPCHFQAPPRRSRQLHTSIRPGLWYSLQDPEVCSGSAPLVARNNGRVGARPGPKVVEGAVDPLAKTSSENVRTPYLSTTFTDIVRRESSPSPLCMTDIGLKGTVRSITTAPSPDLPLEEGERRADTDTHARGVFSLGRATTLVTADWGSCSGGVPVKFGNQSSLPYLRLRRFCHIMKSTIHPRCV